MKTQYLVNEKGVKKAVIIPINQYNKLMEMAEEYEDIVAYDLAKAQNTEFVSADEAFAEIEASRQ